MVWLARWYRSSMLKRTIVRHTGLPWLSCRRRAAYWPFWNDDECGIYHEEPFHWLRDIALLDSPNRCRRSSLRLLAWTCMASGQTSVLVIACIRTLMDL